MPTTCACLELATAVRGFRLFSLRDDPDGGPILEIQEAARYGRLNPLWTKEHAVRLAFRANMEQAEASGNGARSVRRLLTMRAQRLGLSLEQYADYVADMAEMAREEAMRETQARWEAQQVRLAQEAENEAPV